MHHQRNAVLLSQCRRGRNTEGQCGVEGTPLVTNPTVVLDLHQSDTATLAAGRTSSGATTAGGELFTWGCGRAGKLGHGTAVDVRSPLRVESLVGRSHIAAAALGEQHSLFLDSEGRLWSCGENKEGQLGVGAPLEAMAAAQHSAWQAATGGTLSMTLAQLLQQHGHGRAADLRAHLSR